VVGIVLKAGTEVGQAGHTEEVGTAGAGGIGWKAGIDWEADIAGAEGTGNQAEHTEAGEGTARAGSCLQAE
jgi:hypothetical protein